MNEVKSGATYKYFCRSCSKYFDNGYKKYKDRNNGKCTHCGNTDVKLVGEKAFKIGEPHEGHEGISSRSDKYWKNAEENRIKNAKKRAAEEDEKMQYDAEYRERAIAAMNRRELDDTDED